METKTTTKAPGEAYVAPEGAIKSAPRGNFRSGGGARPGGRGPRKFEDRPKPEFDQKILSIRRVTRVVAGGRRFSFAVSIAIGNKKGGIGVGTGKAVDTSLAINKAVKNWLDTSPRTGMGFSS